uniref:BRCT domain-containing protein n=1 Tax=Electrophorus electricus TaxID=8005 RepID=A0A4W4ELB8_ELEEL
MLQATPWTLLRKRRQPEVTCAHPKQETKFRDVIMYLVERRMGKSRRMFLTSLARSKGFCVEDTLSDKVTHIIAEANPAHELWSWLHGQSLTDPDSTNVLDISWFTESMEAGRPVLVEAKHCIQEIYECGSSSRVENILSDEKYQTLKLFTSVFGVGPKTGDKWYRRGLRALEQVHSEPSIQLNKMQAAGTPLIHMHTHISKPVSRAEAKAVGCIIEEVASCFSSSVTITLTGGFRR